MARTDVFALRDSDLNAFLFAEVGTELNGSDLTILSVLARLGQDPWTEAARWAGLPKAAASECLAQSIALMPMSRQELAEARTTAARLIALLPNQTRPAPQGDQPRGEYSNLVRVLTILTVPLRWSRATLLSCCVAAALALALVVVPMLVSHVAAPIGSLQQPTVPATP